MADDPRTLTGILNRRAVLEQDIRFATYGGPDGAEGLHTVWLPSSSQPGAPAVRWLVSSTQAGMTWAPGSQVPIATPAGNGNQAMILGSPPPGRAGAAFFATVEYPASPPPLPSGSVWAFFNSGGAGIHAWIYNGGTFLERRGTLTGGLTGDPGGFTIEGADLSVSALIDRDPVSGFSPGSMAFVIGTAGVLGWDVDNGRVTWRPAATAVSYEPVIAFWQGWVYWLQTALTAVEPGVFKATISLMKARPSLASAAMVGSRTIDLILTSEGSEGMVALSLLIGSASAIGYFAITDLVTSSLIDSFAIVFPLAGGTAMLVDPQAVPDSAVSQGLPLPPGIVAMRAGATLERKPEDAGSGWSSLWPVTGSWALDSVINASLTPAGQASIYGNRGSDRVLLVDNAGPLSGPAPRKRFIVTAEPSSGSPPDLMFLLR